MFTFLSCVTFVLVVVTFLPLWRNPHWLVRSWDYPRLQLGSLAILLLVAELALLELDTPGQWLVLAGTLFCLAWHAWRILPYTPCWRREVKSAPDDDRPRLRILAANVLQTNRSAEKLNGIIASCRPDILVAMETDQWWQEQLDHLEKDMPYTMKCPLDNLYGMLVYSRLPLEEKVVDFLVEEDIPSMHCLVRLRSGDAVRMHFVHPAPPSPTENEESTERDAELVIVGRSAARRKQPVIVAGDLNDVAWSATTRLFKRVSGLLDPRIGRGLYNTFHADHVFLRWPLDHLFHSEHFTVSAIQRLGHTGSDHFPLFTELALTPGEKDEQEKAGRESGDEARTRELAANENVSAEDVPRPGRPDR